MRVLVVPGAGKATLPSGKPTNSFYSSGTHLLRTHKAAHARPQPLQCAGSLVVSTHAPSQFLRPELHLTLHTPSLHSDVPFGTTGQRLPHAPQWFTSSRVFTQVPSQATMSRPSQLTPQTPLVQVGEPPLPLLLQTFPHAPQFDVSLVRSTHEPEHSSRPSSQSDPSHEPAVHTSSAPHVVSQLPQCARSESKSVHTPLQFV